MPEKRQLVRSRLGSADEVAPPALEEFPTKEHRLAVQSALLKLSAPPGLVMKEQSVMVVLVPEMVTAR